MHRFALLLGTFLLAACATSADAYTLAQLRDNKNNALRLPVGDWNDYMGQIEDMRAGTYDDVLKLINKPKLTLQEAALALYFASSKGYANKKLSESESNKLMFAAADLYLDPLANVNLARLSQRGYEFSGLRQPSPDMTFRYLNRAWETGQVFTENKVGVDIWEMVANGTLGLADGFYAADINEEYPTFKTLNKLRPELLTFRNEFAKLYRLKPSTETTTVFERHY